MGFPLEVLDLKHKLPISFRFGDDGGNKWHGVDGWPMVDVPFGYPTWVTKWNALWMLTKDEVLSWCCLFFLFVLPFCSTWIECILLVYIHWTCLLLSSFFGINKPNEANEILHVIAVDEEQFFFSWILCIVAYYKVLFNFLIDMHNFTDSGLKSKCDIFPTHIIYCWGRPNTTKSWVIIPPLYFFTKGLGINSFFFINPSYKYFFLEKEKFV